MLDTLKTQAKPILVVSAFILTWLAVGYALNWPLP